MPTWEVFSTELAKQKKHSPHARTTSIPAASMSLQVADEIDAYRKLEALRWPNGPVCPHCGCTVVYFIEPSNGVDRRTHAGNRSVRRLWKCGDCRRQFSVLIGSWLQGTKVPLHKWFQAIELLERGGHIPVRVLAETTGTSPRTALLMRNKIREAFGWDKMTPMRITPRHGIRE